MSMESTTGERGEQVPDTETVATRERLRKGLSVLLNNSYGVDFDKVLKNKRHVTVMLYFEDLNRRALPDALTRFVQERFHGRSVGIKQIKVGYTIGSRWEHGRTISMGPQAYIDIGVTHLYPGSSEKAEPELQRVVVDHDEVTGMPITEKVGVLERREDFKYVILPHLNMVVPNRVALFPSETPMEWRMTSYPLESWIEKKVKLTAVERLEKSSDSLNRLIDPYGLGLTEETEHTSSRGTPDVFKGPLQPTIVDIVARLLPDLPKTSSIPEPRKEIIIR